MLAAALSSRRNSSVRFQTFYIIYIMRNRTVDAALHRRGLLLLIAAQEMPPFPQTYTPFAADIRRTFLGAWTSRHSFDGTTEKRLGIDQNNRQY